MQKLQKLDNEQLSWFHIRITLIAGLCFFTDAYDLFNTTLLSQMFGFVYYGYNSNKIPTTQNTALTISAIIGSLVGQLIFGYLGDKYGRQRLLPYQLLIVVIATIVQCFSSNTPSGMSVVAMLILWRIILGIGLGANQATVALISCEFANIKNRGALIAATFAMQGFAVLAACSVSLIVLSGFQTQINNNVNNIDYVWRIIIAVGAVPGILAIYFSHTLTESPRYNVKIEKPDTINNGNKIINNSSNEAEAGQQTQTNQTINLQKYLKHIMKFKNLKPLLTTSLCWFLLSLAYYGLTLNNSSILSAVGYINKGSQYQILYNISLGNFVLVLMGPIPGYWFSVFLIDLVGRKKLQYIGFLLLFIIYQILGGQFNNIVDVPNLFIVIYSFASFFMCLGPYTTTYVIPSECFKTKYRSTSYGIASAMGKLGAIISQAGFLSLKDNGGTNKYIPQLIQILSTFMILGFIVTYFVPETKDIPLDKEGNIQQNQVTNDTFQSNIELQQQ